MNSHCGTQEKISAKIFFYSSNTGHRWSSFLYHDMRLFEGALHLSFYVVLIFIQAILERLNYPLISAIIVLTVLNSLEGHRFKTVICQDKKCEMSCGNRNGATKEK